MRIFMLVLFVSGFVSADVLAQVTVPKKWNPKSGMLFSGSPRQLKNFESATDFELTLHPRGKNVPRLIVDSEFILKDGVLQSGTGNGALLKVAEGKDITLTFDIDFQGAGGWCLLWGMKGGTGHGFWNHQLRVSGAHNCLISSVDGELKQPINLDTPYEFKGPTRVGLSIQEDGQVTLASGSKTIFSESYDLPDDGDVLIGTWSNQYGPRPIKIHRIHLKN